MVRKASIPLLVAAIAAMILAAIHAPESRLASLAPLLPPFVAIFLAFITGEVLLSLFSGVWIGAIFLVGFGSLGEFLAAILHGFGRTVDHFLLDSLCDKDKLSILLFTVAIGGLVGLIARTGGTRGIVRLALRFVKGPRTAQLAAWLMGLSVFFDDYASCLITGNTVRPMTDRLRVSREKLSYIIDCTAAPIACIAFISTWIGFEIGLLQDAFVKENLSFDPYFIFLQSIPYSFYSIYTILFVFLIAALGRDFGPMRRAERRARAEGKLHEDGALLISSPELDNMEPPAGVIPRARNALLPVVALIGGIVAGLYWTGAGRLLDKPDIEIFDASVFAQPGLVDRDLFVARAGGRIPGLDARSGARYALACHRAAHEAGIHPEILLCAHLAARGGRLEPSATADPDHAAALAAFAARLVERARAEGEEGSPMNAVLAEIGGDAASAGTRYHRARYDTLVGLRDILGASESFRVLLWASFGAGLLAMLLAIGQGILTVKESFIAWFDGGKAMAMAVMVLSLSWALGAVCGEMKTAKFVSELTSGYILAEWLPLLTFVTACLISFATGTSWGTMTILVPIVVKLAIDTTAATPADTETILVFTVGAILSGAIFGDHCSPISDTTIMSSLSGACDHIHHVRTQIPYALTVGALAALLGYVPATHGIAHWAALHLLALVAMVAILRLFGRPVDQPGDPRPDPEAADPAPAPVAAA